MPLVFSEEAVKRLPAPIVERLLSVIARIRRVLWWKGLWLTFTAAMVALLLVMAVDGAFDLESVLVRCALSFAGLVLVLGVAWKHLVRPLSRSLSLAAVARAVEFHHPEMQERISTAVELLASDDPSSLRGSEELLGEVVKSAVMDVAGVSPEAEFSSSSALWPKRLAVGAVVALALVLAIWPFHGGMLMARALLPFANIGSASAFDLRVLTQDATVAEGEPLTILVAARGRAARRVDLHHRIDNALTTERLLPSKSAQVEKGETGFALHLPVVRDGFRYHVTSGRARTREFTITVLKRPDITGLSVTYTPPAYTGLDPRTDPESSGDLVALTGTSIEVTARLSQPAVSAHLQYDLTENAGPPVTVETDPTKGTPVARWSALLGAGTDYRWTLHPQGERDVLGKPRSGSLRSLEDLSPAVVIDSPVDRELDLRPNDILPILYTAADDYGFSAVELMVKLEGKDGPIVTVPLPTRDPLEDQTWHGTGTLELSKLPLVGIKEMRICVRVSDNLPPALQGPQMTQSEEILIRLDWGAQSFARQSVNKQEEQIRAELEQIKNELWDEHGLADEKRRQLREPDQMRAEQFEQLEKLTERATQSAEKLAATAAKMEKSAYAERAESVEDAARSMVKPAAESLALIPQFDSPEQRSASAADARDHLQAAAKSIEAVLASLDQDQEQAQETADLATLAEQQQQLANEAKTGARTPATTPRAAATLEPPATAASPSTPAAPPSEQPSSAPPPEERAQALHQWQEHQEFVASETGNFSSRFQKQSPPDKQSSLQKLAESVQSLAAQARALAEKQEGVEKASLQSPRDPPVAAEAAQRQAEVASEAEDLAGAVEEFSHQARGTLQQNGIATANTHQAERALEQASETGRTAVNALAQEASRSDQSDKSAKSDQPAPPAQATPAQQAAEQTGQSLDRAATALQEAVQALTNQAEGIATASQALEAATEETEQAAAAGQQAREAGDQAGQQAAEQAARSGHDPQQAAQRAANAAQEQARAQHAAEPAQQAANNLALAAASAQAAMGIPKDSLTSQNMGQRGSPKPGDGQSGQNQEQNQNAAQPGKSPSNRAGLQTTKDYGLPPELAKLGMTVDDWARLRGFVQSGSEAAGGDRVPVEYRELVKGYFRALSAGANPPP